MKTDNGIRKDACPLCGSDSWVYEEEGGEPVRIEPGHVTMRFKAHCTECGRDFHCDVDHEETDRLECIPYDSYRDEDDRRDLYFAIGYNGAHIGAICVPYNPRLKEALTTSAEERAVLSLIWETHPLIVYRLEIHPLLSLSEVPRAVAEYIGIHSDFRTELLIEEFFRSGRIPSGSKCCDEILRNGGL